MTKILSEPSLHVEQDSSINLTCIASAIEQPGGKGSTSYSAETGVLWYKNDKVIHILIHITWQIYRGSTYIFAHEHNIWYYLIFIFLAVSKVKSILLYQE